MRFPLIPRNYRFYDLFEQSARNLVTAAEAMVDLMQHFENVNAKTARIKELEHVGDGIIHEIVEQFRSGEQGKVIGVEDIEGGERVEIYVE